MIIMKMIRDREERHDEYLLNDANKRVTEDRRLYVKRS